MKKRFLAVFLALALCVGLAPAAWAADDDFKIDKDGVLTGYNGPGGSVIIPDGVTEIAVRAFRNCSTLKSVTIPSSVTRIGDSAFAGCTGLTGVIIPDSVTRIEARAFTKCTSLADVTIGRGVTDIGMWAFSECSSLTSLAILAPAPVVHGEAFSGCSVRELTIACGLKETLGFKSSSFWNPEFDFQFLTSVTFLAGVTGPDALEFSSCMNLQEINAASDNTSCASVDGVLFNKEKTTLIAYPSAKTAPSYTVPDGVTRIGDYAFWRYAGRDSLTSVTLPDGLTTIGDSAFGQRTSLTSINISGSVASIGKQAFQGCEGLKDVYYGGTEAQWGAVKIDSSNAPLTSAAIHYSGANPCAVHSYDDGVVTTPATSTAEGVITYTCTVCGETKTDAIPKLSAAPAFTDVPDWCADPVAWAVGREITDGTGDNKFSPHDDCKHAEILTFLWRAAGKPTSSAALPVDIAGKNVDWAADALRWAAEKGMIDGTLDPAARCTRADAVTYIWKALGKTEVDGEQAFSDVPAGAGYARAVAWAVANGVTNGYEDGTFGPGKTCSRGEIVTFLYRACR